VQAVSALGCGFGHGVAAGLPSSSTCPQVSGPFGQVGQGPSEGWWCVHGAEELGEVLAPGPAFGQMQGEVAGGAGQAGGDVDQVVTDGGGGRSGMERSGQGAGGAGQVVRQGRQSEPGGIGLEMPDGAWAKALFVTSAITCSTTACRR
jgi:hypothetical protein